LSAAILSGELTHEDIIGLGTLAADLEQLHQVEELAMDIATNLGLSIVNLLIYSQ
jgi:hypothetical protein